MRFARYWVSQTTGDVVAVFEQEQPFEKNDFKIVNAQGIEYPTQSYDLGLVEDFQPTNIDGSPASPSAHIFARLKHHPTRGGIAKTGTELPPIIDCPATKEGLKNKLRAVGPKGISIKARAWLKLILSPSEAENLGLSTGIPLSALASLATMRARRDPQGGQDLINLQKSIQESSDIRSAVSLEKRLRDDSYESPSKIFDREESIRTQKKQAQEESQRLQIEDTKRLEAEEAANIAKINEGINAAKLAEELSRKDALAKITADKLIADAEAEKATKIQADLESVAKASILRPRPSVVTPTVELPNKLKKAPNG